MNLLLIGANHRSAPVEVRDDLHMPPEELVRLYEQVRPDSDTLSELAVLSTCNRTELYGIADDPNLAGQFLRDTVQAFKGVSHFTNGNYTYCYSGEGAIRHLFRVATGLDSLMVGEPQILGQVKEALSLAENGSGAGALLTKLFQTAVRSGKRARSETAIGQGAVSVAFAAMVLATKVYANLSKRRVLVVGAGETGTLTGRHFAEQNPQSLMVINRTRERAERLAGELGGVVRPWEKLAETLLEADVVVCATSAPEPVIQKAMVEEALYERKRDPMVIIDIAAPRDVDPGVGELSRVFLYDLDALESVVQQNLALRAKEIPRVETIIEEEVGHFFDWYAGLEIAPIVRAIRGSFEAIAQSEVEKQSKRFAQEDRKQLELFTRSLVKKLLHHPTMKIKQLDRSTRKGLESLEAVRDIFAVKSTDELERSEKSTKSEKNDEETP